MSQCANDQPASITIPLPRPLPTRRPVTSWNVLGRETGASSQKHHSRKSLQSG